MEGFSGLEETNTKVRLEETNTKERLEETNNKERLEETNNKETGVEGFSKHWRLIEIGSLLLLLNICLTHCRGEYLIFFDNSSRTC